jgi:hypothetical protein
MPYLAIWVPKPGTNVLPGLLTVTGMVQWGGGPPTPVSVRLDQQPAVSAVVGSCSYLPPPARGGGFCVWSANVTVPAGAGTHIITATGGDETAETEIVVGGGITTINTDLAGTCIAKSALTLSSSEAIGLQFSESTSGPSSVTITSFPTVTFPASNVATGVNIVVTMSLDPSSPVTGTFEPVTGTISIPGVILDVMATINMSYNTGLPFVGTIMISQSANATLTVMLTTGATSSGDTPPVFTDIGSALVSSGTVTLVGDGTYSAPIFGMTDGGITLTGVIAPVPPLGTT